MAITAINGFKEGETPYRDPIRYIVSRGVEDAAGLEFGKPVELGTDKENQVKLYAGNSFLGVSVKDPRKSSYRDANGDTVIVHKYLKGAAAGILVRGAIIVKTNEAAGVAIGDPVYVGNSDQLFYKQSGAGRTLIANAKYKTATATNNDLAVIHLMGN